MATTEWPATQAGSVLKENVWSHARTILKTAAVIVSIFRPTEPIVAAVVRYVRLVKSAPRESVCSHARKGLLIVKVSV